MVDDKLTDESIPVLDFDTTTKPQGTKNEKVNNKLKFEEKAKKLLAEESLTKSLPTLEKDALEILQQEVVVTLGKDLLNKLKEVFDQSKERGMEHLEEVEAIELICNIAEDEFCSKHLSTPVRESVDQVKEGLEQLLMRVQKIYKEKMISWPTFLGFFTKRGRLRDHEKLKL